LFLRHELQSRAATVSHVPATAAAKVLGDRTQLQQVIVNLVVNALQAMAHDASAGHSISIRSIVHDSRDLALLGRGRRPWHCATPCRTPVRELLYNQGRRHGHGPAHLPLRHRGTWGTHCGGQWVLAWDFTLPVHNTTV
jgi:hypothetical protein